MIVPVSSFRSRLSLALLVALGACAAPRPAAPPAPPPVRRPAPPPAPAPAPPPALGWQDAPLTPGDWSYAKEGGETVARFAGLFEARCDTAARIVRLSVAQPAAPVAGLTITTSDGVVALPAGVANGRLVAQLAGADVKLDGIAFSRGRFAVAAGGGAQLIIPAWPEFARVVEDCRRPA